MKLYLYETTMYLQTYFSQYFTFTINMFYYRMIYIDVEIKCIQKYPTEYQEMQTINQTFSFFIAAWDRW